MVAKSAYLGKLFPDGTFLDGTYVASQVGGLHDVSVDATPVPQKDGGLGVTLDDGKVENSVRDVGIANGILLVCDEPDKIVSLYSLSDGSYLGSSNPLGSAPTHLADLQWRPLCERRIDALLGATAAIPAIGVARLAAGCPDTAHRQQDRWHLVRDEGPAATVYIPFQEGTGRAVGGSIFTYGVTQQSQSTLPVLTNGAAFVPAGTFADTPEFVLYWSSGS